mgnify:CR=1 FL=1
MSSEKKRLKMAIIAGAAHTLKYKSKHLNASDEETIQHVSRESNEILEKLDTEE